MAQRCRLVHVSGFGVLLCCCLFVWCVYNASWPLGVGPLKHSPTREDNVNRDEQSNSQQQQQRSWIQMQRQDHIKRSRDSLAQDLDSTNNEVDWRNLDSASWLARREELMQNCSRARRVLLFTYMRGGSTLAGQVFNQNPLSMYWYEMADSFYMARYGLPLWTFPQDIKLHPNGTVRRFTYEEMEAFANFFDDVTSCRLSQIPAETLGHPSMSVSDSTNRYYRSLRGGVSSFCTSQLSSVCGTTVAESIDNDCPSKIKTARFCQEDPKLNCPNQTISETNYIFRRHEYCIRRLKQTVNRRMDDLMETCLDATIQISKILRLPMSTMEIIVQKIPDISIIYYTRDPRGIVVSRWKAPHGLRGNLLWKDPSGRKDLVLEARLLCNQIKRDLNAWRELNSKYPGVFLKVRYEDLVKDPDAAIHKMYAHAGRRVHWQVRDWVHAAFNSYSNDGAFGTNRENSTATASAWQYDITPLQWDNLWTECGDVVNELGYPKGERPVSHCDTHPCASHDKQEHNTD